MNTTNRSKLFVIDNHPAIPPSDLLKQWEDKWFNEEEHADVLLIEAFQAGADQELEACCEWLAHNNYPLVVVNKFRAARRPKPKSLKQQALKSLTQFVESMKEFIDDDMEGFNTIRRALESIPDE